MSRKKRRNAPRTRVPHSGVSVFVHGRGAAPHDAATSRQDRDLAPPRLEVEEWRRGSSSIDHGAAGRVPGWQALIERLVDWQADRTGELSPRPEVARLRRERPGVSACRACRLCEDLPSHPPFQSELRKARPGTDQPFSACGSAPRDPVTPAPACDLSYLGELEPDRSLRATFDRRDWSPRFRRRDG